MIICIMNIYYVTFLPKDAPIVFSPFIYMFLAQLQTRSSNYYQSHQFVVIYVRHFLKNSRAFYIILDFSFEKRLFLKYFKNNFKIF